MPDTAASAASRQPDPGNDHDLGGARRLPRAWPVLAAAMTAICHPGMPPAMMVRTTAAGRVPAAPPRTPWNGMYGAALTNPPAAMHHEPLTARGTPESP